MFAPQTVGAVVCITVSGNFGSAVFTDKIFGSAAEFFHLISPCCLKLSVCLQKSKFLMMSFYLHNIILVIYFHYSDYSYIHLLMLLVL